jgi:hypothetical protein
MSAERDYLDYLADIMALVLADESGRKGDVI